MDLEVLVLLGAVALFMLDFGLLSTKKVTKKRNLVGLTVTMFGLVLITAAYVLLLGALASDKFQISGVYLARCVAAWRFNLHVT